MVLYLRGINKYGDQYRVFNFVRHLALIALLREEGFKKQGILEYNFLQFREAIQTVFAIRKSMENE